MKLQVIFSLIILAISFNTFAETNQCEIVVKEEYLSEGFSAHDIDFVDASGDILFSEYRSLFFAYRESLDDENSSDRKYLIKLAKAGCDSLICVDDNLGRRFFGNCPKWFSNK